jgi:hypothetical protein
MSTLWLTQLVDRVAAQILAMEQRDAFPTALHVHPTVFDAMRRIRAAELDRGMELLLLGIPVSPSSGLAPDGFLVVP